MTDTTTAGPAAEPLVGDTEPLTVHDRCDSCGAQARARVTLTSMGELLFCGHHYHRNRAALEPLVLAARLEDIPS